MKHEPFMRMCTHGFHAVFHGEMAVGGADAIAGCLSQVTDDLTCTSNEKRLRVPNSEKNS